MTTKRLGGASGKGFMPGHSGNPGGRPKGIRTAVRMRVGVNADKVIDGLCVVAFGNKKDVDGFFGDTFDVRAKDRVDAMRLILQSLFCLKASQRELDADIPAKIAAVIDAMPDEESRQLRYWLLKYRSKIHRK